jgi:hypothetical protein
VNARAAYSLKRVVDRGLPPQAVSACLHRIVGHQELKADPTSQQRRAGLSLSLLGPFAPIRFPNPLQLLWRFDLQADGRFASQVSGRPATSVMPRSCWRWTALTSGHRSRTLPSSVSNMPPPLCLTGVAVGIADDEPSTSLKLGPVGPLCCCCCATAQTFCCIVSVFL